MAIKLTPREIAEKHAQRLIGATQDIERGVSRVTESPMEKAAENVDKYLAGVQRAAQSGKWQAGLRRMDLGEWKDRMIKKGIPRIAAGVQASMGKTTAFWEDMLPHIEQGKATISSMPDLTLEHNIARMTSFVRHMAEFKRRS